MKQPTTRIGAFFLFIILVLVQAFQVKLGLRKEIDVTYPSVVRTTEVDWQNATYDWDYIVYPTKKTTAPPEPGEDGTIFNLTLGGSGSNIPNCSSTCRNGATVVCGNSSSTDFAPGGYTSGWKLPFGFVTKLSTAGEVVWSRGIGGNGMASVKGCTVLSDGSIVAVGYTVATNLVNKNNPAANTVNCFIFRYSSAGELLWSFSPNTSGHDYFNCVAPLPGGGYVVGGSSTSCEGDFSFKSSMPGAVLMGFDSSNNVVFSSSVEGSTGARYAGIDVDSNGNIFASLITNCSDGDLARFSGLGMGENDSLICKFNSSGEMLWGRAIAGGGSDNFTSVAADGMGGCCAAGYYSTAHNAGQTDGSFADYFNFGKEDGFAFFLDANGTITGAREFAGVEYDCVSEVKRIGSRFVFTGYTRSYNRTFAEVGNYGDYDAFAVLTDLEGSTVRLITMAGSESDRAFTACAGASSDIVIIGATSSFDEFFASSRPVPQRADTLFAAKYRID